MDKINDAIRLCLKQCRESDDPMGTAMRCLRDLRVDPNWTHDEIVQVRNGVITMLQEQRIDPPRST